MLLSERQKTVVSIWRQWRKNMRDLNDGWFPYYDISKQLGLFYEYLQGNRPALLDIPNSDSLVQVKAWIIADLES